MIEQLKEVQYRYACIDSVRHPVSVSYLQPLTYLFSVGSCLEPTAPIMLDLLHYYDTPQLSFVLRSPRFDHIGRLVYSSYFRPFWLADPIWYDIASRCMLLGKYLYTALVGIGQCIFLLIPSSLPSCQPQK